MSSGLKFVPMPKDIQERIIKIIRAIEREEIDAEYGASFFMNYFVGRLTLIADNHPKSEKLHKLAKDQKFALVVKKPDGYLIKHTAIIGDRINDFEYKAGVKSREIPAIVFKDVDIFLDVLLNKKEMMQAIAEKKLELTKMSKLLKWMAPIIALNNKETEKLLERECPILMEKVLDKIEAEL
ncbi:MAG: hypothetical protein GF329_11455 [Candidatus Lokiarchaeota archaeon]|nr:hypothetical protein [Candidatus Lokiarchaeota archaeon]